MKKGLLLIGTLLLCFTSCKKGNVIKKDIIVLSADRLAKASSIFVKNNVDEVSKVNELGGYYKFLLGDYNNDGEVDLYAIKKYNKETDFAEIHILSGASNYKSSLLKTTTALKGLESDSEFELGDYNNDGKVDLYAIKKQSDQIDFVEIHVLNGASNYTNSLLKTTTVLKGSESNYEFELGDYNSDKKIDLYAIKKYNKGMNFTKVYVLSGASNYTSSLLKMETALSKPEAGYEFKLRDCNNDGKVDLYAIKKQKSVAVASISSVTPIQIYL